VLAIGTRNLDDLILKPQGEASPGTGLVFGVGEREACNCCFRASLAVLRTGADSGFGFQINSFLNSFHLILDRRI